MLEKLSPDKTNYYFVRLPHEVSGICMKLPEKFFPGFEGQMFNEKLELRWKKQGNGYDVLLLSQVKLADFNKIEVDWEISDRTGYWYLTSENKQLKQPAQFPKEFLFLDSDGNSIKPEDIKIGQRYFQDKKLEPFILLLLPLILIMTKTPPSRPQKPTPPTPARSRNYSDETIAPKPYQLVPFPKNRPSLKAPIGHHKYQRDRLHGTLFLTLKVHTPLHVSTGVVVMGSDIGNNRISLIKIMVQGIDQKLIIQGSSLKGCIRSVYEAITKSCICKTKANTNQIPDGYRECKINRKENRVNICPACQAFGAMDWQGLIEFNDAECEKVAFSVGFMPSLYRPRPDQSNAYFDARGKAAGRKFYYHTTRAIDKGENKGIPVQQAAREYIFRTEIQFKNLQSAELGTLLIVLGQDPKYPIALKVGGGKPIGMGTMTVDVTEANVLQEFSDFKERYSSYNPPNRTRLTGEKLRQFQQKMIQSAHSQLVQKTQHDQLTEILHYPTDREPPSGMY